MSLETRAKAEYELLFETGELLDIFPNYTGVWKKDKKDFITYFELNEAILNTPLDFEDAFQDFHEE
jgi:hypothetical protein